MLKKIFEKSLLGSLVRSATMVNPDLQLELSKHKLRSFEGFIKTLYDL